MEPANNRHKRPSKRRRFARVLFVLVTIFLSVSVSYNAGFATLALEKLYGKADYWTTSDDENHQSLNATHDGTELLNVTSGAVLIVDASLTNATSSREAGKRDELLESSPEPFSNTEKAPLNETVANINASLTNETTFDTREAEKSSLASLPKGDESNSNTTSAPPQQQEPLAHPHAGARDANGNFGYVADVTRVHRWISERYEQYRKEQETSPNNSSSSILSKFSYLPFTDVNEMNSICQVAPGQGVEGESGWDLLVNHVKINDYYTLNSDNKEEETAAASVNATTNQTVSSSRSDAPSRGKILCVVYTYDAKRAFISAITETWGWRCDGFFAASTKTVTNTTPGTGFGGIDLPHLGGESYNTMWQKTRSIMGYLYDNYMDEYDYFYLCGDDAHLIVENLRLYLGVVEREKGVDRPLVMGHHVRIRRTVMIGGGPGYVVNKAGLKLFGEKVLPECEPTTLVSAEDRYMSNCMRKHGAELVDTADDQHAQRFIGIDADWMARENPWASRSWLLPFYGLWEEQGHGQRWGKNATSTHTVSFHRLKKPFKMKRHHAVLYRSCPLGTVLGDALAKSDKARSSNEASNNGGLASS